MRTSIKHGSENKLVCSFVLLLIFIYEHDTLEVIFRDYYLFDEFKWVLAIVEDVVCHACFACCDQQEFSLILQVMYRWYPSLLTFSL